MWSKFFFSKLRRNLPRRSDKRFVESPKHNASPLRDIEIPALPLFCALHARCKGVTRFFSAQISTTRECRPRGESVKIWCPYLFRLGRYKRFADILENILVPFFKVFGELKTGKEYVHPFSGRVGNRAFPTFREGVMLRSRNFDRTVPSTGERRPRSLVEKNPLERAPGAWDRISLWARSRGVVWIFFLQNLSCSLSPRGAHLVKISFRNLFYSRSYSTLKIDFF